MSTGSRRDPYLGFNFKVEVDGLVVGGFSDVSGIAAESEILEFREGGLNEYTHKRAGPIKYPGNLILKRGISEAAGLWSWFVDVMQGTVDRKTVSIILLDSSCQETRRWSFQRAYPVKWEGPTLRAAAAEISVETVELAHDGLLPNASPAGIEISVEFSIGASFSASASISASASLSANASFSAGD
jgi:phage tail-like protein